MIGLVVFSFVKSGQRPSKCNKRLAQATLKVVDRALRDKWGHVYVVAEWEVAEELARLGFTVHETVYPGYGSSETLDIWDQARNFFIEKEIRKVIPIAHPFYQLAMVKKVIGSEPYFRLNLQYVHLIRRIGFERKLDPVRIIYRKIIQKFGRFGKYY